MMSKWVEEDEKPFVCVHLRLGGVFNDQEGLRPSESKTSPSDGTFFLNPNRRFTLPTHNLIT